ncbi:thiol reductant ABC exporter subunit CydD [Curtanaerobium respiraculi]|uniref:thiol reductant ABC exporter subunit CydD n=1 Tax=Curtanaerobium respiraculi TaxID=2949669 RepID=UPI0024B346BD|nr:thiol reductant ABC exporter subunit CydD [Curtanaerobium respiraculi]
MAESDKPSLLALPGAKAQLAALTAFALAQAACIVALSLALAAALANMWAGEDALSQLGLIAVVFSGFLGQRLLVIAQDAVIGRYARQRADELRNELLECVFVDQTHVALDQGAAATVSQAIEGTAQVESYIRLILPKMVGVVALTVPLLACVFALDWVSGLILVLVFPIVALFMAILGKMAREYAEQQFGAYNRMANSFIDTLRGLGTLVAFGASRKERDSIFSSSEKFREATMRTLEVATLSGAALDLICVMGLAAIAIMLAFRLMDGSLALRTGLACLILAPEVTNPLRTFAADFHASLDGRSALKHAQKLIAESRSRKGDASDLRIGEWSGESVLKLDGIGFSYGTGAGRGAAIGHATFEARGFQRIGIVGTSGSGKSTLAALLGGFEVPTAGSFEIDGGTTPSLRMPSWQRQVLFVPQNPTIFHDTLRTNLAFYTPDAPDGIVEQAARTVGLDGLVEQLPQGLDTVIGEGGRGLSGGQAQRIALARALLDPARRILIFDEPTAHLDIEVELELKERMIPLMEGRLVFFCTHRLHWLKQMDRVVVLDGGSVVQQGAPDELLAVEGPLTAMARTLGAGGAHDVA